ncbi:MAG: hypothetical protein JWN19_2221, partial [Arthrobacter sp.]|nr:hypothetical protein [Arthrobacter sp.]
LSAGFPLSLFSLMNSQHCAEAH